jgi:hypothetical protein
MKTIIVLPDGTTWNTIDGCSICIIKDEDFNRLCNDQVDANDLEPVVEIGLKEFYGTQST